MRKVSFLMLLILAFAACKKKGCTDEIAVNYAEAAKKDDGSCEYKPVIIDTGGITVEIPLTYKFERNGESTVSFGGQKERLDMLSEMVTYLKTGNTPGTKLEATKLTNMFGNENSPFSNADLNASTKQLKSKTAGGDPGIVGHFENWIKDIAAISDSTVSGKYEGMSGKPGVVQSGTKAYLQSAKGHEYTQLIEKGLMGAVMMHQISHVYLGEDKMNVENEALEDGKTYTKMEHHWDEAFGYLFGTVNFPNEGTDRFWGKYIDGRNGLLESNKKLLDAFILGRHSISQKDMATRDAQILIIRAELEKVCVATAIHYLKSAKNDIADDALRNHSLSEAWAFMDNLKYANGGKLSIAQIEAHKTKIGDDFYAVSAGNLTSVIDELASTYGFESIKDQL